LWKLGESKPKHKNKVMKVKGTTRRWKGREKEEAG
jgi:hypothetical protein